MLDQFLKISDGELYSRCKHYGEISLKYRWKFAGLLPEVYRRRLYKKKGYESIFEFAAKLAGMSERQVYVVLNLGKKFETKPILKNMLEHGEVSINKLARIASVVTTDNEAFWATQAKLLPKTALETLVRDEKFLPGHHANSKLTMPQEVNISAEVKQKLLELQQKGIDINAMLLEFLEKRELEIAQEKEKLSVEAKTTESRYIPAATRKLLQKEYGEKCSITSCNKPSEEIHHNQRFSLAQTHDPKFLAPLCREHHIIAHTVDLQFREFRARAGP
ncbi:hypothetical protein HYW83_01485 [Candidatus Peregrinibacteria bacterium]|nr:hypothetical protein [Candidatus Peregrinibacteria bacterium]